jgi:hypothetical protein
MTNNFYDPTKKVINKFTINPTARINLKKSREKLTNQEFENEFMKENQGNPKDEVNSAKGDQEEGEIN